MNIRFKSIIIILLVLSSVISIQELTNLNQTHTIINKTNSSVRIDYVDASGNLTVASNEGYATVIKELDENGHTIYETYYDPLGIPVTGSSGQYAIVREWCGNRNTKITYLDALGLPTYNNSGYVSRIQEYNDDGQISSEFYLNENDESVSNTRGEYGRAFEYDSEGRKYKITSLDENGEPVLNSSGYCYVIKTFYVDDSVDMEMYYDTEGNPVKLSSGQYGIKYIGSQTVKLDADGNRIFSVNEIFKEFPWLTVLLGSILVILIVLLPQKWRIVFLALYILSILYETLITRETGGGLELTPFWSYKQFFSNYSLRLEIMNNIWLFVPYGAGLYSLLRKCQPIKSDIESNRDIEYQKYRFVHALWFLILVSMIFSIIIEASQYFFALGLCEVDDVISNTLGAAIGVMMASSLLEIKEAHQHRKS